MEQQERVIRISEWNHASCYDLSMRRNGDANKSANTSSRLQWVSHPENGLINHILQNCQDTGSQHGGCLLNYAVGTPCTTKASVRHHLYIKTGSGCDRTFPDIFGWGKTDIQNRFRKSEIESMTDEEKKTTQTSLIIPDYQVTSAERLKHITNEMFLNGPCDADSHSPLMVYIRSRSESKERGNQRAKEHNQKKKENTWGSSGRYNKAYGYDQPGWKGSGMTTSI